MKRSLDKSLEMLIRNELLLGCCDSYVRKEV